MRSGTSDRSTIAPKARPAGLTSDSVARSRLGRPSRWGLVCKPRLENRSRRRQSLPPRITAFEIDRYEPKERRDPETEVEEALPSGSTFRFLSRGPSSFRSPREQFRIGVEVRKLPPSSMQGGEPCPTKSKKPP